MAKLPYVIDYKKPAEKFFRKHEKVRKAYEDYLKDFLTGEHPERVDVKTIKGKRNEYYRMRIGEWRIIYMILDGKITVINTLLAGSRGDIYKKISGLN